MLSLLHIENIAVIESADISFDGGFNALTGETGAGKSIVVDAIGAILGQRTSRDLIRTGARSALVEGVFTALPALPWFATYGGAPDENGELLLQREIQGDGKNVCRVGGRLVTVAQLKELGDQLVNIHGQHDGQQLLDPTCHLSYLDRFGGLEADLAGFQASFGRVSTLRHEMAALEMDESEKARRIDSLEHQIQELERAQLQSGEEETLTRRRNTLRNAGKLLEAVEQAHGALYGDEERIGALDCIEQAESALNKGASLSEELAVLAEKASQLRYAADDVAECIRDLRGTLDTEPGELEEVENRLDLLYRLRRKYGNTVEEMLAHLEGCRKELDEIELSANTLAWLDGELSRSVKEAGEKGAALTIRRREAALILERRIATELAGLDMKKVQFQVAIEGKGEGGMDATGMDQVCFLMSANVGETLKPIHKIASGGELSRIMLGLKNVLAENDDVTTLVFDEVDAGVSGRAAQKVAEKLAMVAQHKQVLCVTHLPQLAAMADTHFSVEKVVRKERTFTEVERLTFERRKEEVARLTSGESITAAALASAQELLQAAKDFKMVDKAHNSR